MRPGGALLVDGFLAQAASVGVWAGTILWTVLLAASCLAILLSLPGGWIALGLAVLYDAFFGFDAVGWVRLSVFAGLLMVGEIVEAILGSVYVARKGATKWGVVGAFAGGVAGAILGSPVFPVVGTLVGGFAGAFAGAVAGEYLRDRRLEPSLRVGFHATVGRLLAAITKSTLAATGATISVVAAFRALA